MTIGWYVHHHGAGHLHRFLAVRDALGDDVVGMGSSPRPAGLPHDAWLQLPGDVPDGEADDPTAGGALHWAPRNVPGLRERTATIAAWAARETPAALVVDVSAEIALLGRLLSVPTVLVAQRGRRADPAHRAARQGASAVVAPWTAATHAPEDAPGGPPPIFCGALSRFDGRPAPPDARPPASPVRRVLLLVGSGGHELEADVVASAVEATPAVRWDVAGALRPPAHPRIVDHGPRADVWALLHRADVVVGTAGGNVVAEVAAARRPLVLLPQPRPFQEQRRQAELLADAGLTTTRTAWPPAEHWPRLLADAARRGGTGWDALHDGRGAARMAAAVRAVADGQDPAAAARHVGSGGPREVDDRRTTVRVDRSRTPTTTAGAAEHRAGLPCG